MSNISLLHFQYPDEVVQHCVNNLINESIEERKCAVKTMRYIFKVSLPVSGIEAERN